MTTWLNEKRFAVVGVLVALALAGLGAATQAHAQSPYPFDLTDASVALTNPDGSFSRQAGAHPDLTTYVAFPQAPNPSGGQPLLLANPRDVRVDLPPGVTGNPNSVPKCKASDLVLSTTFAGCGPETQIGLATIGDGSPSPQTAAIFNMETPQDAPARFAFVYLGLPVYIDGDVRPSDYGISALSAQISQAEPLYSVQIAFWGEPMNASHNAQRWDPNKNAPGYGDFGASSSAPPRAFMTNSTSCSDTSRPVTISADSWQDPGSFASRTISADPDGTPLVTDGCDRLPFDPSIDVRSLSRTADAPSGLDVDLVVPQSDVPTGLATAHVKRVSVVLPPGMSVSPSSAAGLGACAPDQIALGSNADATCPASSKIGTVEIDTPLLADPLKGDIVLAKPDDNPFHSLIALYVVAKGPGFVIKLSGRVDLDPVTGQLTTTFDNNPQLPFSALHLQFRGGSQAPLATPPSCGTYAIRSEITSWASDVPVVKNGTMTIDDGCDTRVFAPSFSAGMVNPAAGANSPFAFTLTRPDRTQGLANIAATLPAGLLAHIASVPQCPDAQANAGTCGDASSVGSVSALSGPGAVPLSLKGRVFLTGPYKGAPFGLSIVVPTAGQAGPFDLGNVVVRATISVDRTDAHVTVVSDPLPTIIRGIPLRLRQVSLSIDRPGFMFNPTSCTQQTIAGQFGSMDGAQQSVQVAFRPLGCSDLDMTQKLALRFTGAATRDGQHPGISAKLTAQAGGANLKQATVKLPLAVALDPDNAEALCTPEQRAARACPRNTIVGTASARSILPDALTGPVYFVQGIRKTASGRLQKTLPKLWIPLSADGVTIDVNASSAVDSLKRLVTTFDNLPDAPISEFDLRIAGGRHGIIVVSGSPGTCDRSKEVDAQFTGQNGKVLEQSPDATVEGCRPHIVQSKASTRAVTLRLSGIGAGRLTLSGRGLTSASRRIKKATAATVTAKLTRSMVEQLRRHGHVAITTTVRFTPAHGKSSTMHEAVNIKR
jgi:hypothetical protein